MSAPAMSGRKVAVVTGANKGIGFAIVRALCKQWDGDVLLTSRDLSRGEAAVVALQGENLQPKYRQLDITDKSSIEGLKTFLLETYGGLDILVNNAGLVFHWKSTAPFSEQADVTMATNYFANLDVCNVLFPILRSHARVVNMSSVLSQRTLTRCSGPLRTRILGLASIQELTTLMTEFVNSAKKGDFAERGWPQSAYGVSKIAVTTMSCIQQRDLDKDTSRTDIVVNACCPGFVNTDMTDHKGIKSPDEGADTPVYLALLPPNEANVRGQFVVERQVSKWE